jgi:choline transporter-like protein 2/4/5
MICVVAMNDIKANKTIP